MAKNVVRRLVEYGAEFRDPLLLTSTARFEKRVDAWVAHSKIYRAISNLNSSTVNGTKRLDFIAGHLDILDRKFSSLLQFNGIIAAAAGLYLNKSGVDHLSNWFIAFYGCWGLTTIISLASLARARWGDFSGFTEAEAEDAEDAQVITMIEEVVDRTALLRFTLLIVLIGMLFFGTGLLRGEPAPDKGEEKKPENAIHVTQPKPPATVTKDPIIIHSFASGIGCSILPLKGDMEAAVSTIAANGWNRINIIGSADVMPLRQDLRKEFGDNPGLAQARAYCVAGWLANALKNSHSKTEIVEVSGKHEPNTSPEAQFKGYPLDRIVKIQASDEPINKESGK